MPPNSTQNNSTSADTHWISDGNAGGGGNTLGFGIDPGKIATKAFEGFVKSLFKGAVDLINGFNKIIFGIDVPGNPRSITSWGPPKTGLWTGAWDLYWALAPLAFIALIYQAMEATGGPERETEQKLGEIVKCALMILVGWPIAIGGLHLADGIAMAFVPNGGKFFATGGNLAKLGLGGVVGAAALFFETSMALAALVIVLVERIVLIGAVASWPVWWGFRPSDNGFTNSASGIGLSAYLGVAGAKVFQSTLAFLVYKSDWSIAGNGSAFINIVASGVALGVVFIGIPYVVARNFVPEAMTVLGTPAVDVADDFAESNREAAKETTKDYASSARSYVSSRLNDSPIPTQSSTSSNSETNVASNQSTSDTTDTPNSDSSNGSDASTMTRARRIASRRRERRPDD
ncbi:hypothetical protein DMJ13_25995 [halophilic archaeon]|nr:hypothetical protein DMJ13_25995 [halophilic archaeon]